MSKQSEAVKTWRQRTKDRVIEAMGGKCYTCGYDKPCQAAFDLHHLDRDSKNFSFGGLRANPVSWARIVAELRNCVLLCATCHREIESGFRVLENVASTFDEAYVEYELGDRRQVQGRMVLCERCGVEFLHYGKQKYCSDMCLIAHTRKEKERRNRRLQRPR